MPSLKKGDPFLWKGLGFTRFGVIQHIDTYGRCIVAFERGLFMTLPALFVLEEMLNLPPEGAFE